MLKHRHQLDSQIDQPRVSDDACLAQIAQQVKDEPLVPRGHECLIMTSPQLKVELFSLGQPNAEIDLKELQYPIGQVGIRLYACRRHSYFLESEKRFEQQGVVVPRPL